MDLRHELLQCEDSFTACFAQIHADGALTRFRDDLIPDMYDHNYTVIHQPFAGARQAEMIGAEMALCRSEGKDYCQIRLDGDAAPVVGGIAPEVSCYGLYHRACGHPLGTAKNTSCTILRAESTEQVTDRCNVELAGYADTHGADFCRRKNERNSDVYLAPGEVDTYICYQDGRPVGKADLFIHNDIAMIEDFDVAPNEQRKGYGTAILCALTEAAAARGAKTALLVTDMDDTAKDMYEKLGFSHLPGRTGLFYRLGK